MIIQNGVGITTLLNGNTVKQALSPANETVNRGVYNPTTLSAVDADLAPGNIAGGVTIFGFLGTLVPILTAEAQSATGCIIAEDADTTARALYIIDMAQGTQIDPFITKTDTFSANSLAVAAFAGVIRSQLSGMVVRLYMNGVNVATSATIGTAHSRVTVFGDRALSGAVVCKVVIDNVSAGESDFHWIGATTTNTTWCPSLVIGCVKQT